MTRPAQPFGKRGRRPTPASPATARTAVARPASALAPQSLGAQRMGDLPPDLLAQVLGSSGIMPIAAAPAKAAVPRSYRAAILAGFVVAILHAAGATTFASHAAGGLSAFAPGSAKVPVTIGLVLAALCSGAKDSAFCLLVAHRLLARLGYTSHFAYVLGSTSASLAAAAGAYALGMASGTAGLANAVLCGAAAGLFYRLFAGTSPVAA